jgi:two-component system chemotaxis sensor kinase CheA
MAHIKTNSLFKRIASYLLILSLISALSISSYQAFQDWKRGIEDINREIQLSFDVNQNAIVDSVWVFNIDQTKLIIDGMSRFPNIDKITLNLKDSRDNTKYSSGNGISKNTIIKDFELKSKDGNVIGNITITAGLDKLTDRIINQSIKLIFGQMLFAMIQALIMIFLFENFIAKHLRTMVQFFTDKKTGNNLILNRKNNKKDELTILHESINNMITEIRSYSEDLEKKVEKRTIELSKKHRDLSAILDSLNQGIFTIDEDLRVGLDYSTYLKEIFPHKNLDDINIINLLFEESNLNLDHISQIKSVLLASIGDEFVSFVCNNHVLPLEFQSKLDGKEKILQTEWQALLDEKNIVEKILVSVKDVTEVNKLRKALMEKQIENEMIGQILNIGIPKFVKFTQASNSYLNICKEIISNKKYDEDQINAIFRNIHTIKGNARTYKLSHAVDHIHIAEEYLSSLKNQSYIIDESKMKEAIENVETSLNLYNVIYHEKLNFQNQLKESISEKIFSIIDGVYERHHASLSDKMQEILDIYQDYSFKSLSSILDEDIKHLSDIAVSLKRITPKIQIDDGDVKFSIKHDQVLRDIFGHVFKNALAHGIETPEIRESLHKTPYGHITIQVRHIKTDQNDDVFIRIFDDGQGLNINKIAQKAKDRGINTASLHARDIAQYVFISGLSTRDEVSDIAGRGVGLDAVKDMLQKHFKGDIIIEMTEETQKDYMAFVYLIRISYKYIV